MAEEWKDMINYEGLYQVSNLGNVKSLDRYIKTKNGNGEYTAKLKGSIKKPSVHKSGYVILCLWKDGKQKTVFLHQLVAMAFLNHVPNGHELVVDHIDNNKLNNRLDNLQIITHRENVSKDTFRNNITSLHTGVSWSKKSKKWVAQIVTNGVHEFLGSFHCELEASEAYQKALQLHNQETIT